MTMPDYDEMGVPERVYVAPGMPGWPGVWTEEREDDESVPYTRSDLVADAVKALEGVIRVADRATPEFDAAKAALNRLKEKDPTHD